MMSASPLQMDLKELPERERRVLVRALARQPTDRWPSCQAFVKALAESLQLQAFSMTRKAAAGFAVAKSTTRRV